MSKKQQYAVFGAILVAIVGLIYILSGPSKVDVMTVDERDMPVRIRSEANVAALYRANVEPVISGPIASFSVKVGDAVKEGQLLATIDTSSQQQQLSALLNQLSQAQSLGRSKSRTVVVPGAISKADVERAKYMMDAGIITEKEYQTIASRSESKILTTGYEDGGADVSGIEAAIQQVQDQMNQAQVMSPIDGYVAAIYNEDQKVALPGRPIILVQKLNPIVASLSIPQMFAMKLATPEAKETMQVYLQLADEQIPGELTFIDTVSPLGTPSVLIKVVFNNERNLLKPGEFYTLVIETQATAKALVVSPKAVHTNKEGTFVYVITEDDTVDVRVVEVGEEHDGVIPVMNGLKKGDRIITSSGTFELGEKVIVK